MKQEPEIDPYVLERVKQLRDGGMEEAEAVVVADFQVKAERALAIQEGEEWQAMLDAEDEAQYIAWRDENLRVTPQEPDNPYDISPVVIPF